VDRPVPKEGGPKKGIIFQELQEPNWFVKFNLAKGASLKNFPRGIGVRRIDPYLS